MYGDLYFGGAGGIYDKNKHDSSYRFIFIIIFAYNAKKVRMQWLISID